MTLQKLKASNVYPSARLFHKQNIKSYEMARHLHMIRICIFSQLQMIMSWLSSAHGWQNHRQISPSISVDNNVYVCLFISETTPFPLNFVEIQFIFALDRLTVQWNRRYKPSIFITIVMVEAKTNKKQAPTQTKNHPKQMEKNCKIKSKDGKEKKASIQSGRQIIKRALKKKIVDVLFIAVCVSVSQPKIFFFPYLHSIQSSAFAFGRTQTAHFEGSFVR